MVWLLCEPIFHTALAPSMGDILIVVTLRNIHIAGFRGKITAQSRDEASAPCHSPVTPPPTRFILQSSPSAFPGSGSPPAFAAHLLPLSNFSTHLFSAHSLHVQPLLDNVLPFVLLSLSPALHMCRQKIKANLLNLHSYNKKCIKYSVNLLQYSITPHARLVDRAGGY